jgi:hypothetical protein
LYCQECGHEVTGNICSECDTLVQPLQDDLNDDYEFYMWGQAFAKQLGFGAIIIATIFSGASGTVGIVESLLPVFVFAILIFTRKSVKIIKASVTAVFILAFIQFSVGLIIKPDLYTSGLVSNIFSIYILFKVRKF